MPEDRLGGITRREALKRGALIGGAIWAAPVVQAVGMRPALADTVSPVDCISYIALNIERCDGELQMCVIKFEADDPLFEDDPGAFPGCEAFQPNGEKCEGGSGGFDWKGPDASGAITLVVPAGVIVTASAVKTNVDCCEMGPTSPFASACDAPQHELLFNCPSCA